MKNIFLLKLHSLKYFVLGFCIHFSFNYQYVDVFYILYWMENINLFHIYLFLTFPFNCKYMDPIYIHHRLGTDMEIVAGTAGTPVEPYEIM